MRNIFMYVYFGIAHGKSNFLAFDSATSWTIQLQIFIETDFSKTVSIWLHFDKSVCIHNAHCTLFHSLVPFPFECDSHIKYMHIHKRKMICECYLAWRIINISFLLVIHHWYFMMKCFKCEKPAHKCIIYIHCGYVEYIHILVSFFIPFCCRIQR